MADQSKKRSSSHELPVSGVMSWFSAKTEPSSAPLSNSPPSGCPVDHKSQPESGCPVDHKSLSAAPNASSPLINVSPCGRANESDESAINPKNMMEYPDQSVSKGQKYKLNTTRQSSSIPKGDYTPAHQEKDNPTWMYPSEQQYFNAMRRKGWNPKENDMGTIVAIHNSINEQGWKEVVKWESKYSSQPPKLVRFVGRPKDVSPKARLMSFIGYSLPFDRHDWFVERDGEEVRYVIDFYSGNTDSKQVGVYMDVRPALDSVTSLRDRIAWQFEEKFRPLLPFGGHLSKASTNAMSKKLPSKDTVERTEVCDAPPQSNDEAKK